MTYNIEDTDLDQMDKLIDYYNGIRREEGFGSVWSMWTTDEWQDMEDVSGIPEGTVIRYLSIWGDRGKESYSTVEGKTWLDVWKACDRAIEKSGDAHHIFIEALSSLTIEREDGTVEKFLELTTGS